MVGPWPFTPLSVANANPRSLPLAGLPKGRGLWIDYPAILAGPGRALNLPRGLEQLYRGGEEKSTPHHPGHPGVGQPARIFTQQMTEGSVLLLHSKGLVGFSARVSHLSF